MFTIYHIAFYLLFAIFFSLRNLRNQKRLFWLIILLIILVSCIRDINNYSDLPGYYNYYLTGEVIDNGWGDNGSIGFEFLNKFFLFIGVPFQLFLFFIGAFVLYTYGHFIEKYSTSIFFSLLLFVLTTLILSMVALRQAIACGIGMMIFDAVLKHKLLYFIILTLLAGLFHTSAFILLPVYFIYHIDTSKKNIILLSICCILLIVGLNVVASYVSLFSQYYAHYVNVEEQGSLFRSIMKIYICLLYIYVLGKDIFRKDIRYLVLICFMINIILYLGGSQIYGIYRLRIFFEISEIIGIPLIWHYACKQNQIKKTIVWFALACYIGLLFISYNNLINNKDVIVDNSVYKTCF